jgi:hypothetical protein
MDMDNRMELLEGLEPIFVENPHKNADKVQKIEEFSCASNLPACDGPIYSNTYWLPEDVEVLLDDLRDGMLGG